ncbi:hypothetical protein, partial [Stenotrophomonas maltophilia]|uniref:hypothetical protein n=1 Tax=Stenotrophomonas maltophilia TaxID=40324 RepID=UPI001C400A5C
PGARIRSVPARLPLPSGSTPRSLYPLDQYCFPARRPLALQRLTARRAERAVIVQADYDKSIDQDQRAVKV